MGTVDTAAARTANDCHEIDGRYFTIGPRLQPLVRVLLAGCSEEAARAEVGKLSDGRHWETAQLAAFLDEIFGSFGVVIEQISRDGESIWRLRAASTGVGRLSPQSALRCRVTVVPETAARRAAGAADWLYGAAGIAFAAFLWAFAMTLYVKRFGIAGFSTDLLFAPLQPISAVSAFTITLAILSSSLFHEIGHCAAASAFGARVGRIGFGIYWVSPAFFSDVSSAWTLSRWQRVVVDCGGIYFQTLACAVYAILAASVGSHNVQTALQTSIMVNVLSIFCSLDPLMKYDGYWILSDALDIPNLRRRSEGALSDLMRSGKERGTKNRLFLLGYGVLSILFTILFVTVLALSMRNHLSEAAVFPAHVWAVMRHDVELRRFGPEVGELGLALVRLIPVACAPVAVATAVSSMLGFLRRMTVSSKN
jgi:hypothetical protein